MSTLQTPPEVTNNSRAAALYFDTINRLLAQIAVMQAQIVALQARVTALETP